MADETITTAAIHILSLIAHPSTIVPLSRGVAEWTLSVGELGLVIFAAILVGGLIGEHIAEKRRERWQPISIRPSGRNWPLIWLAVVVVSVLAELFCDAAIWEASDSLQAIANHETEELKSANLELEAQIQPREADADQRETIAQALEPFRGSHLIVRMYPTDAESFRLSLELNEAFSQAGIIVATGFITPLPDRMLFGAEIHAPPGNAAFAEALRDSLERAVGYKASIFPGNEVILAIGVKPLPGLK
jgi:hypothetical protein